MKGPKSVIKKLFTAILGSEQTHKLAGNYSDFKTLMTCWVSAVYWESMRRLRIYKNEHAGARCFIIGNGPSLRKMDLCPLKHEYTFGLDRIYLLFDSMGFSITYSVSVDKYVIE